MTSTPPEPVDGETLRILAAVLAVDAPHLVAALDEHDPADAGYWADDTEHLRRTQSVVRREVYAALTAARDAHGARWARLNHARQVAAVLAALTEQRRA